MMATRKGKSASDLAPVGTRRSNGWFWLGVASLAGGILLANSFGPDGGAVMLSSGSSFNAGSNAPAGSLYRQPETGLNATLQQLIDSGRLDPPPGNTHKMYSIASPFNHAPPAALQGSLPGDAGGRQSRLQTETGGSPFQRSDALGTSGTAQAIQSANSRTQAEVQSIEFDTPPGVGSSTGGLQ